MLSGYWSLCNACWKAIFCARKLSAFVEQKSVLWIVASNSDICACNCRYLVECTTEMALSVLSRQNTLWVREKRMKKRWRK
jgi:hypothetical protein